MSFEDARDTGQSTPASSAASNQQETKFTLALVLETLSDLCSKSKENAAKRDDLVAEMRETCPYWKKDDMKESRKLVDEYLEEGRKQNLCSSLPNEAWRYGFKRPVYKIRPRGSPTLCPKTTGSPPPELFKTARLSLSEITPSEKKEVETEKCHRCGKMCEVEVLETRKFCYDMHCLMDILKDIRDKKEKESTEKKEVTPSNISLPTMAKSEKVSEKVVTIKMCVECGKKVEKEAEVMRQEYTIEQLLEMLEKMHKRYFDQKLKKRKEKKKRKKRKSKKSKKSGSRKSKNGRKSKKSRKSTSEKSGRKKLKKKKKKSGKKIRNSKKSGKESANPTDKEVVKVDNVSLPTPLATNIEETDGVQRKEVVEQQKSHPEPIYKQTDESKEPKKSRRKNKQRKASDKKDRI